MIKYATVIDQATKRCNVGNGNDSAFYTRIGMKPMEVEQAYDGQWYLKGYAPEKSQEVKEQEVRAIRNSYLEKYVDPKQLVLVWNSMTEDEQKEYTDYRQYLLNYPETENWYESNPLTFDEWKKLHRNSGKLEQIVDGGEKLMFKAIKDNKIIAISDTDSSFSYLECDSIAGEPEHTTSDYVQVNGEFVLTASRDNIKQNEEQIVATGD